MLVIGPAGLFDEEAYHSIDPIPLDYPDSGSEAKTPTPIRLPQKLW